jgi:hypothetical protein
MLEPDEGKLSSPVLRGPAPSNGGWPLGTEEIAKDWRRSPREKSRFLAALGMTCFIMVRECRVLRG